MSLFEVRDLVVHRGGTPILHGVSLRVEASEAVCILGRNGVGKTTLLRSVMGLTPARSGRVLLSGQDLSGRRPHVVARAGIGYVPQGRRVFPRHTVMQNLLIATRRSHDTADLLGRVLDLFPALGGHMSQPAGTLSGGQQQMLAIARCLVLGPRLLLLDEPTEGLQPSIVEDLVPALAQAREQFGTALLLVEQNLDFAFAIGTRGYVLEKGTVACEGTVETLRDDALIREYLIV